MRYRYQFDNGSAIECEASTPKMGLVSILDKIPEDIEVVSVQVLRNNPESEKFKNGWATGSMVCGKCERVFEGVRFCYSCHDKVEGEWPRCCGELANWGDDWREE